MSPYYYYTCSGLVSVTGNYAFALDILFNKQYTVA